MCWPLPVALGRVRIRQPHIAAQRWTKEDLDDMLFYGMLGVVIGGRLGEVLFYHPLEYFANPLEIFKVWRGGMSFHGGFLGVLIAMAVWARKAGRNLLDVYDFIAPLVPLGYAAGRLGNFINAELPGRVVSDPSLPWAMLWPTMPTRWRRIRVPAGAAPSVAAVPDADRWPAGVRDPVAVCTKQRPRLAVGAFYTLLYGCARFGTEYFRTPDWETTVLGLPITSGQVLSLPMIAGAIAMLVWAYTRTPAGPSAAAALAQDRAGGAQR
jgi:phosphatidylglycerol:prolipoprotein diacylglycerol transferase